ncbi:ABC transporter substrate-binding protein [Myxococcota bacterium]|nr:ABC transporter substrate-binding protein [Myxococcota bacterium]
MQHHRGLSAALGRALILVAALASLHCTDRRDTPPALYPVRVAVAPAYSSLPVYVAQLEGLFERHGLAVTLERTDPGQAAFEQLGAGRADFAIGREFAFVRHHFAHPQQRLQIVASLASSSAEALVARRDRGITQAADLRGKRVAAPFGGFLHFNLSRFLLLHHVAPSEVGVVDLPFERCLDAVLRGDADAAMLIENLVHFAEARLGDGLVIWTQRGSLPHHWVLVGSAEAIAARPEISRRVVAALLDAQRFVHAHPARAMSMFGEAVARTPESLTFARDTTIFNLGLDQALVVAMEDQTRWLDALGPVKTSSIPNYLSMLYVGALEAVRPEAITIFR